MTGATTPPPSRPGPADGLRLHSATLREHADRLRSAASDLDWPGPQGAAFRGRIAEFAQRCATAADGLALSAARLDESVRRT